MPTARELLEQADALMRRNRRRGRQRGEPADADDAASARVDGADGALRRRRSPSPATTNRCASPIADRAGYA